MVEAQIYVTAKDTGAVQTYVVQFQEESPQIQRLELRLPEGQELKEDQTVPLEVIAHYQDGSQASLKADQIDVATAAGSQGKAVATNKGLELREAGLVHLQASFQGKTGELTFTITPNPEEKTVVKVRPVRISTDRNVLPALPETVLVEYDKGFPKEKRVTWDAVTADQVKDYHSFTVTGHVEGVEKEAQAQVTVEGIIAVEEVSTTTPVGEKPALPESVRTYHSNGKTYAAKVAWGCGRSATLGPRRRSCPSRPCRRNQPSNTSSYSCFRKHSQGSQCSRAMDRICLATRFCK